jgi:hypothetical protein
MKAGNPVTIVKMLGALLNLTEAPFYNIAKPAFDSAVLWVRNQALLAATRAAAYRNEISDEFFANIAMDVANGRFFSRASAYIRAAWLTRDRIANAQLGATTLATIAAGCICLMVIFPLYLLIDHFDIDPEWYPFGDWSDLIAYDPTSTLATVFLWSMPAVMAGSLWYFSWARENEIEYICIVTPFVSVCVILAARFLATGHVFSLVVVIGLSELVVLALIILAVPALLAHYGNVLLYWALAQVATGRVIDIAELFKHANTETRAGTIIAKARNAFVGVYAAIIRNFQDPRLMKLWLMSVMEFLREEGIRLGLGISILALSLAALGGVIYGGEQEFGTHQDQFEMGGFVAAGTFGTATFVFSIYKLLKPQLRLWYSMWLLSRINLDVWRREMQRDDPHFQARLLRGVTHDTFKVLLPTFYNAVVELEQNIHSEPALSSYWFLRHQLEAALRQRRGDEPSARL